MFGRYGRRILDRLRRELLGQAGVVITPGIGYGQHGEGYFRISLTVPGRGIEEAMSRIRQAYR